MTVLPRRLGLAHGSIGRSHQRAGHIRGLHPFPLCKWSHTERQPTAARHAVRVTGVGPAVRKTPGPRSSSN